MKGDLREWNKSVFSFADKVINDKKLEIECLDAVDDTFDLNEHERIQWKNALLNYSVTFIGKKKFSTKRPRRPSY